MNCEPKGSSREGERWAEMRRDESGLTWRIININTHISPSLYLTPSLSISQCNWHWTSGGGTTACMLFVWCVRQAAASRSDNILTHLSVRQLRQPASSSPSASSWSNYKLSEGRGDKFENYEHNSSLDHAADNGTEEAFQIQMESNGNTWMKWKWKSSRSYQTNLSLSPSLSFSPFLSLSAHTCIQHRANLTPVDKLAILRTLGLGDYFNFRLWALPKVPP